MEIYNHEVTKVFPEETRIISGKSVTVIPIEFKEVKMQVVSYIVPKNPPKPEGLVVPIKKNPILKHWYEETMKRVKPIQKEIDGKILSFATISKTDKKLYKPDFNIMGFFIQNESLMFINILYDHKASSENIGEERLKKFIGYFEKIEFV